MGVVYERYQKMMMMMMMHMQQAIGFKRVEVVHYNLFLVAADGVLRSQGTSKH